MQLNSVLPISDLDWDYEDFSVLQQPASDTSGLTYIPKLTGIKSVYTEIWVDLPEIC